jgi:hypothetical protein
MSRAVCIKAYSFYASGPYYQDVCDAIHSVAGVRRNLVRQAIAENADILLNFEQFGRISAYLLSKRGPVRASLAGMLPSKPTEDFYGYDWRPVNR